jgi:hypothetical protein
MLRERSDREYESGSEGGVRHLFKLGQYEFQDTLDGDEGMHHFIRGGAPEGADPLSYEVDRETMYEFMARYLAGRFELEEYGLEQSPSHLALLDMLEIATARARAGESDFSWEEYDEVENELMDDEDDPDDEDGPAQTGEPEEPR